MFALLKLIQSIIKTLHSAGTPGQVAAGMALGSALGLTPLMQLHNLVIISLLILLNVSFGGGMLGWALFVPVGFLLDPIFDRIGLGLLTSPTLRPLWTDLTNTPILFARNPEWSVMFDMDGAKAIETRKRILDMSSADRVRTAFYHGPFPSVGQIGREGRGYRLDMLPWQDAL